MAVIRKEGHATRLEYPQIDVEPDDGTAETVEKVEPALDADHSDGAYDRRNGNQTWVAKGSDVRLFGEREADAHSRDHDLRNVEPCAVEHFIVSAHSEADGELRDQFTAYIRATSVLMIWYPRIAPKCWQNTQA